MKLKLNNKFLPFIVALPLLLSACESEAPLDEYKRLTQEMTIKTQETVNAYRECDNGIPPNQVLKFEACANPLIDLFMISIRTIGERRNVLREDIGKTLTAEIDEKLRNDMQIFSEVQKILEVRNRKIYDQG